MTKRSASPTHPPVVIVGAGPSGLLLAIELLRRDVPVRIFEKHKDLTQLTQATSVKPRSLDILDDLGLIEAFYKRGVEIQKFRFLKDGTHFAEVDFGLIEGAHKCTLSLPETETVDILGERIRSLGRMVEFGTTCTDFSQCEDRVDVSIDIDGHQDVVAASWLVGADGYHSRVRDLIGARLEGTEYPETWAAVDARIDGWSFEDGRVDLCLGLPLVAPFPIGNDTWRLVFGPCEDTDDPISAIIGRLGETRAGANPIFETPVQYFHANAKIADKFQSGRVFLIGDAAHATNPMDGHGMNMGLQDAFNLGWKLAHAWHGQATEELLSSYAVERREVNSIAVNTGVTTNSRLMDRTGKLLEAHFETLSDSEQKRVSAMGASEKVWSYGPNAILSRAEGHAPQLAGSVAPSIDGLVWNGKTVRLADLLRHTDMTILHLLGNSTNLDAVSEAATATRAFPALRHIVVTSEDPASFDLDGIDLVRDPQNRFWKTFNAKNPMICAIRADHHISYLGQCHAPDLVGHLSCLFRTENSAST